MFDHLAKGRFIFGISPGPNLSKRRHERCEYGDPIEEVRIQRAIRSDERVKAAVGRRDEAEIGMPAFVIAESMEAAALHGRHE